MGLNTTQNVEDSTLAELMAALGDDGSATQALLSEVSVPVEEVKIEEVLSAPIVSATSKVETRVKAEPKAKKHYTNKVDRMKDTLGADFGKAMLLERGDLELKGKARAAKEDEVSALIKDSGVKVQNRITFILEFAQGKTASLNNVMQTALDLLESDGKITSGEKGNLVEALLKSGKTIATSRAMANNTITAMRTLRVIIGKEPQVFYANPESVILDRLGK